MQNKGLLIVISGPSGAGKGTICRELLAKKDMELELSISATTRMPRMGEVDGINYFFKQKEKFLEMIQNNEFIEYAQVFDNYYGTPKKYVQNKLDEGKNVILEIDVQGAAQVKQNYEDAVLIFILPPSLKELRERICGRGTEVKADIDKRLSKAYDEVCCICNYDYVVINDEVEKAVDKICSIITAEKCKLKRCNINIKNFKEE